jgi:putative FmdB family regulatory protein
MPIYEYRCRDCAQVFEEWQKEHEPLDIDCPVCGGKGEHIISNTSFVLKGSGWYVTDYARGNSCSAGGNGNGNGDGSKKKEDKSADSSDSATTKPESKPEGKGESAKAADSSST